MFYLICKSVYGLIHTNDFFVTDSVRICVRKNGLHRYHMGTFTPIKISTDIFFKMGTASNFIYLLYKNLMYEKLNNF